MTKSETKRMRQDHLKRWRESGQTQRRYCEQNGLSYWNFRTWAGKLKNERPISTAGLVKLDLAGKMPIAGNPIEIRCGEVRVFVDGATAPEYLARMIAALEKRHDR